MKKLVIKTAVITIVSLLGAVIVAFGAFAMFAPGSVAEFFDGVGSYSTSVFFYERQFEKSADFEDLALLVNKIDDEKDAERADKYLLLFINHEEFNSYCLGKTTMGVPLSEYYLGRYEDLQQ